MKKDLSIYIHIPFCEQKCHYCDFNSYAGLETYFAAYAESLTEEILGCAELKNANIFTVFIGGGTPSVLSSKSVEKIMTALSNYQIASNAEITIEANPNSLSKEKLRAYKSFGINRLSIGLQAYQSHLLKILGRLHSAKDFLLCIESAKSAGFNNISADLIFALPGQSLSDWEESLREAVKTGLSHISCYGLTIEENTAFFQKYTAIDEELDRKMYYMAVDLLGMHGFSRYEISNFAKAGCTSRHNSVYWERGDYLGFGLSAHSLYNNIRFENTGDLSEYLAKAGTAPLRTNVLKLTNQDIMEEFMFLGLRMSKGISAKKFMQEFGVNLYEVYGDVINKNVNDELLEISGDNIKLTDKGIDLSNVVLSGFIG